jgi:uncharacterized protein YukE
MTSSINILALLCVLCITVQSAATDPATLSNDLEDQCQELQEAWVDYSGAFSKFKSEFDQPRPDFDNLVNLLRERLQETKQFDQLMTLNYISVGILITILMAVLFVRLYFAEKADPVRDQPDKPKTN